MRLSLTTLVICLLCSSITADSRDWPMYQHDLQHSGYSPSRMPQLKEKWVDESPILGPTYLAISGDKVYAARESFISVLDIHTGSELWNVEDTIANWTFPVIEDNKIYVTSDSGIYCLDGNTGEETWSHIVYLLHFYSFPIIVGNHVVIGSGHAIIDVGLDPEARQAAENAVQHARRVLCLDKETGEIVWKFYGNDWVVFSPAYFDGRVYINDGGRFVYCLDEKTGKLIWNKGTQWHNASSVSLDGKRVFVGTSHGLVCLDLKTGKILWKFECKDWITQCPSVGYDKVFFGSVDGMFYCLEAETGKEIWKMDIEYPNSAPAIVADNRVALGTNRGTLYIVKAKSGEIVESLNLGGSEITSLALSDGKLLVGQMNGKITCFEGTPPEEASEEENEDKSETLILTGIAIALLSVVLSLAIIVKRCRK